MKFSVLIAIIADSLEEQAIDVARRAGAGGVTILDARGMGAREKKTFLGLTYEGSQSVLIFVLEQHLAHRVLERLDSELELTLSSRGVVFTVPLEYLSGIGYEQLQQFSAHLHDDTPPRN